MGTLQSKINNFVKVHTIPNVLTALLNELENPEASSASIAKIISKDISLTAKLLRVANSPFYKRQSEIASVEMAVTILGMKAVKAQALSVSMFDIANPKDMAQFSDIKDFWRHNMEVAVIAGELARHIRGLQPEEAFVCGLMHDLGILFFIQELPEQYKSVLSQIRAGKNIEAAELEIMGMTHSEAGSKIAHAWRLPQIIQDSIAFHHLRDGGLPESSSPEIWRIVNLAHRFCHMGLDVDEKLNAASIENRHNVSKTFGIDSQTACEILASVPDLVLNAASFLDVDIGDPIALLRNANEQLGNLYEEYEETILENERLHARVLEQERSKVALEALRTTLATFSHYVNNATAAIVGRAQILELYLNQGKLEDNDGKIAQSVKIISESVDTICAVLDELKEFPEFKTVSYHGSSRILDIDKNIKARLGRLA